MAFKMKGSPLQRNFGTPTKQLKPEYMRSPEEKELYSSPKGKDYEPVPSGEIRGIGTYSRYTGPNTTKEGTFGPVKDKETGDIESFGTGYPSKKKKSTGPVKPGGDEAMYAEIDALGERPNPFDDREGHDAWMEKMETIRSSYGE